MHRSRALAPALTGALIAVLVGCSAPAGAALSSATPSAGTASASASAAPSDRAAAAVEPTPAKPSSAAPSPTPSGQPVPRETTAPTRTASLTIPEIGLTSLRVVPYEGTTDDWPGTRIQNRGVAASPYGEQGGVGPGEIGNYLVTAHRLSAGGPLRALPSLDKGDSVFVAAGGTVYEYRITGSRQTSFRSERSLAEQRAAVPGSPGKSPTQAMITISTCATPEDDAAGNFWRDDRGNPEHRIDKIGVLVSTSSQSE
jgi:sortase A